MIALIFHSILISSWLPFLLSPHNPNCCCNFIFSNTTERKSVPKLCPVLLWPHGLSPARLLCPWEFPGKHTGVGCRFLLQGIFPIQGSNLGLLLGRWILYYLSHQGSPQQREVPTSSAGDKLHLLWFLYDVAVSRQLACSIKCSIKTKLIWNSLGVQWLRTLLPMDRLRVQSLLWEDSTCLMVDSLKISCTKAVCRNYWAHTLEPVLCNEKPTLHN